METFTPRSFFLVYQPGISRLSLVRCDCFITIKQLRQRLNLPTSVAQVFSLRPDKYNYLKEILILNEIHLRRI